MFELVHTSVPRGLKEGSSGFCPVAWTTGIPSNLIGPLEQLSGYKPVFPSNSPEAELNPVSCSFQIAMIGGRKRELLSRIAYAGLDYSGRSNKIAHHILPEANERCVDGPVAVFLNEDNFFAEWNRAPQLLPLRRILPAVTESGMAKNWQAAGCDAGWAGAIAEWFMQGKEYAHVIFQVGTDMLPLVEDISCLLTPEDRWRFTFNTYFIALSPGADCFLRFCVEGSEAAVKARRLPGSLTISLSSPSPVPEEFLSSPFVTAARTGHFPKKASPISVFSSPHPEEIEIPEASSEPLNELPATPPPSEAAFNVDVTIPQAERDETMAEPDESRFHLKKAILLGLIVAAAFLLGVGTVYFLPRGHEKMGKRDSVPPDNSIESVTPVTESNPRPEKEEKNVPAASSDPVAQMPPPQPEKKSAPEASSPVPPRVETPAPPPRKPSVPKPNKPVSVVPSRPKTQIAGTMEQVDFLLLWDKFIEACKAQKRSGKPVTMLLWEEKTKGPVPVWLDLKKIGVHELTAFKEPRVYMEVKDNGARIDFYAVNKDKKEHDSRLLDPVISLFQAENSGKTQLKLKAVDYDINLYQDAIIPKVRDISAVIFNGKEFKTTWDEIKDQWNPGRKEDNAIVRKTNIRISQNDIYLEYKMNTELEKKLSRVGKIQFRLFDSDNEVKNGFEQKKTSENIRFYWKSQNYNKLVGELKVYNDTKDKQAKKDARKKLASSVRDIFDLEIPEALMKLQKPLSLETINKDRDSNNMIARYFEGYKIIEEWK